MTFPEYKSESSMGINNKFPSWYFSKSPQAVTAPYICAHLIYLECKEGRARRSAKKQENLRNTSTRKELGHLEQFEHLDQAKNGFIKPKGEVVGLSRRYSNFLDDSETIDILLELGRYIKGF